MNERKWIDIEPGESFFSLRTRSRRKSSIFFDTVKRYNEKMTEQFNSGESSLIFGINVHTIFVRWSLECTLGSRRRIKKEDISTALIFQEQLFTSELLKDTQDVVSLILHYRTMLWFRVNSSIIFTILDVRSNIIRSSTTDWYLEVRIRARDKQYSSCLLIQETKEHQDPEHIDFSVPRRAQYLHSAWKKHQDAVFWVDIDLAIRVGLTFYQTRSNAIIFQEHFQPFAFQKLKDWRLEKSKMRNHTCLSRPPPKISLRHDHDWTRGNDKLGSTVEQQAEGKVVRQSRGEVQHATFSQRIQPILKPICDRSGKLESTEDVCC